MKNSWAAAFVLSLFVSAPAFATNAITYHGRLLKSDSSPVSAANVKLRFRIYSPGAEECLLFDETYTRDLSLTDGRFAVRLGMDTPSSANTEPFALSRIFQNRSTFTFGAGKCASGATYVPAATDGRKIVLSFNDGSLSDWEDAPEQTIAQVPQAIESMSVGGYESSKLFRVHDGAGAPVTLTPWTQANYAKLEGLVAGTDGTYLKTETDPTVPAYLKDGVDWGEVDGKPSTFPAAAHTHPVNEVTSAGGAYFTYQPNNVACSSGQVLKWTASNRWECGNDNSMAGGGTVTSVTASSGSSVVVGGTAADPEIGVQDASTSVKGVVQLATSSDTTAGLVVQANDSRLGDGRVPTGSAGGDLGGSYPDPGVVKIRGVGVSATTPQSAQVLVFDGTNWTPTNFGIDDLRTSGGASQFASANCSAHQTLTWSAVTDAFTCMGISGLNASAVNAGTFDIARLPTGTSGTSVAVGNDARFPSATCGSGNKMRWDGSAWQCEADATGVSSQWTTASSDIYYDAGRVGIGTTTPASNLHVYSAASSAFARIEAPGAAAGLIISSIPSGSKGILFNSGGDSRWFMQVGGNETGSDAGADLHFTRYGDGGAMATALAILRSNGNVGIGTSSPAAILDVNGTASVGSSVESITAYADSSTAYTIPDTSVNLRRITLTGNATLTLPAFTAPAAKVYSLTLFLKQDGTGSRTVTFAGNGSDIVKWDTGAAPTISATAGKITILQLMKPADESTWYGSMVWKEN